jgi:ATP-dependent helicase HrpB
MSNHDEYRGNIRMRNLLITGVLDRLAVALASAPRAVLIAPPGAGKTTFVPPALLAAPWLEGRRIIMLEPRRLAARAVATRMAENLSERLGARVGLRARLMTEVSAATRIEVVTEGVFTRMILDDPELDGVGLVIFDEFHERSLDADFGLALALDAQEGLGSDLRILVMSATLDGGRVSGLLSGGAGEASCSVITAGGRAFPVETRYLGRQTDIPLSRSVAGAVIRALAETSGAVLVFLPGQREIRQAAEELAERLAGRSVDVAPLHGGLDRREQDAALAPASAGRRKVVLASAIAETSLTIEDVTAVVDSGLAREPRFDVGARLTRLETVRVSRASADQRRGRAGRLGPGVAYRLWAEPETQSLRPFAPPEILSADLSALLLDCAAWGVTDPNRLAWLDPPPAAAVSAARDDLESLGALDAEGRLTKFGAVLRDLPLPPRLAAMVARAAGLGAALLAASIAALLVERGLAGNAADLDLRLSRFANDRSDRARRMRNLARRWAWLAERRTAADGKPASAALAEPGIGACLLLAYPDRLAQARGQGRFLLASGGQAYLPEDEPLSHAPFIVVADLQGAARGARITTAAAINLDEAEAVLGDRIAIADDLAFDRDSLSVRARRHRRLGAIVLSEIPAILDDPDATARALAAGIAAAGVDVLPWTKAQHQLRARAAFLRRADPDAWPDLSDTALASTISSWLGPFLASKTAVREITANELSQALDVLLGWDRRRALEARAPTHWQAPTGHSHPIAYDGEHAPSISLRVQELFGLRLHPAIDDGRLPLTLILLSPAHRPIQVTRDLPGFWSGSWFEVRADLGGRYPKHPWPEDPATAEPTTRAKRRGQA